ncbi:MAG TPA: hypothetical protein VGB85_17720 [Nannocystis sp.]
MRSLHRVYLGFTFVAGLVSSACSSSNVGKACDKDSECGGDGLICDVHDGKGTCQEPHGHEAGDDDTAHHASEDTAHHATEDTAHHATEDTAHHTTGTSTEDTSHHDTEDTAHHDTEDTSHDH